MNESKWVCERCGREFDLEYGEGWVNIAPEKPTPQDGKLTPLEPYEKVCYECADELLAVVEKCNMDCLNCEVTSIWGLSIKDCFEFQLMFDVIDYAQIPSPVKDSIQDTKEMLRLLNSL